LHGGVPGALLSSGGAELGAAGVDAL
jgi:hypothetical protein